MRIAELNLLAYGKFTDHTIAFPRTAHDFHVIIGPNEAGKSTVRRAVAELLFGIPVRSPMGFVHDQSDLRLGGVLERGEALMKFVRTKKRRSLETPDGAPLADNSLVPLLGSLARPEFEELHCLNHAGLVKGGESIVNPDSSLGQILFQAASGLEAFSTVRQALSERSSALFGRGSGHELARAESRVASARQSLGNVQVLTRAWESARDALRAAEEALETRRAARRGLDGERTTWERVRRLAPMLQKLEELQQKIAALGETVEFPPGAVDALADGIGKLNTAQAKAQTREEDLATAQAAFDAIVFEEALLPHAAGIEALGTLCKLHPNHARDLPLRRAEAQAGVQAILERSREFGWGDTEADVRRRLPGEREVRAINALLVSRGALVAREGSERKSLLERQAAADELAGELAAIPVVEPDPRLAAALEAAQQFSNSQARQQALQREAESARAAAAQALAAVGLPGVTLELLQAMELPSPERINALRAQREALAKAVELKRTLMEQARDTVASLELRLRQFSRGHKIVTIAEVADARHDRDQQWSALKAAPSELPASAPRFETSIRLADELADAHTQSETLAAEAQALRDQIEAARLEGQLHERACGEKAAELAQFDADWAQAGRAFGPVSLELDDAPQWLARRTSALEAAKAALAPQQAHEAESANAARARDELVAAMKRLGLAADGSEALPVLCARARHHVDEAKRHATRLEDMQPRLQAARAALQRAKSAFEEAKKNLEAWQQGWTQALQAANLDGFGGDVGEVEAAMAAASFIRQRLRDVDTTRTERIQAMEADLADMAGAAAELAGKLDPSLAGASAEDVFAALDGRLKAAVHESNRKAQAQQHLDQARRQRDDARSDVQELQRTLAPFLELAPGQEPLGALRLAKQGQERSGLQAGMEQVLETLREQSDGLSLDAVREEIAGHPAADAVASLTELGGRLEELDKEISALTDTRLVARQAFDAIAGGDRAAVAEAQRQEALAEIGVIAEEYLQVATSETLLRWAIDKYRERKQGPLLQRAGAVFQQLTCGAFEKLGVTFEGTPELLAYRAGGRKTVRLAGLSDGTRDQLFLALRIAALELQAEQGAPVPIIADDLFLNFDDQRSQAGLKALYELSRTTQVIFLSHQEHLLPVIRQMLPDVNVLDLEADAVGA